jgi:hypothetical protein
MAMRRFRRQEFWRELEIRGCHRVSEEADLGSFWLAPDGRHFQVPPPDADDCYPDFMLDDLIRQHGLPRTPRRRGRRSR